MILTPLRGFQKPEPGEKAKFTQGYLAAAFDIIDQMVSLNDSRLTNQRTPQDLSVTTTKIVDGAVTGPKIVDAAIGTLHLNFGIIFNAHIASNALIAKSKLANLAIVDADITSGAAISKSKLAPLALVDADVNTISQAKITGLVAALALLAPQANPTFTGTVTLAANPVSNLQAATKQYVDSVASSGTPDADATTKGKLQLAGDLGGTAAVPTVPQLANKAPVASPIFTGTVTLPGDPASALHATTKQYADALLRSVPTTTRTGSYTGVLADANKTIPVNSASANNFTIASGIYAVGDIIGILQLGTGSTTFVGSGTNMRQRENKFKTAGQYATAFAWQYALNEWIISGDLIA